MFDQIVGALADYPYLVVLGLFLLCGIGLPLPEEVVLLAVGYVCAKWPDKAVMHWMMLTSGGAILSGDLLPFVLGRVFGVRLLRLRWLRMFITKQRLAKFDHWFRRRGDTVIFIARFVAGLRVVAFFTAGTMKMPWRRFLLLDGIGIAVIVPALILLGYHGASFIENMIATVQKVERGLLWGAIGAGALAAVWWWLWRRSQVRRRAAGLPKEAYVQPRRPVESGGGPGATAAPAKQPPESASPAGQTAPGDPPTPADPTVPAEPTTAYEPPAEPPSGPA